MHRLDRVTTGLMCCGKTKEMAQYLSANMNKINKKYHAITIGTETIKPKQSQVF